MQCSERPEQAKAAHSATRVLQEKNIYKGFQRGANAQSRAVQTRWYCLLINPDNKILDASRVEPNIGDIDCCYYTVTPKV